MRRKLIGDRAFYRKVFGVAVPIMIQNGITNFVSMLDNLMVGQVGESEFSGVSIVNQLLFVFYLCIFGAVSGAGIFGAQFFGKQDHRGLRDTLRFKLILGVLLTALGIVVLLFGGETMIGLFLQGEQGAIDPAQTLAAGRQYLWIMLAGLLPFAFAQSYSSTLRETSETIHPMIAGIVAVLVNLVLNALLIFGLLGFPRLGVRGAAIATVISRYVEFLYLALWAHSRKRGFPFMKQLYRSFRIPRDLTRGIIRKGFPLMMNEAFWALGVAWLSQCYTLKGQDVVAAYSITNTIANVISVVWMAMGSAIAILVGQILGTGRMEEARDTAAKLTFFSVCCGVAAGLLMAAVAPFFPLLYKTSADTRALATSFILIYALFAPVVSFTNATYFTIRSGGKTMITFLFDSLYIWVLPLPIAYFMCNYSSVPILPIFLLVQTADLVKCVIGFLLVKKGIWLNNMVENLTGSE